MNNSDHLHFRFSAKNLRSMAYAFTIIGYEDLHKKWDINYETFNINTRFYFDPKTPNRKYYRNN